ncbi:DMT family transporter [Trinickia terrae]|nr:DMT family transporter [Trinickia terrae]
MNPLPGSDYARRVSLILMSLAGLSQGFIGPIVKLVNFAPLPLVVGRSLIAALALHLICLLTRRRLDKADRLNTVICGLLLAGHFATLFMAYKKTDVNLVLIALFTYPMMTSLLEPVFFGGRPQRRQVVSAILVTAGVACLRPAPGGSGDMLAGIGLALLSALLFSVRNILSRKLVARSDGLAIMGWQTTIAALVFAPSCAGLNLAEVPLTVWLGVLALGIFFTAIPHTLRILVKRHLTTATVDILAALQVVGGLLLAWGLVHEALTANVLLGASLVLTAVLAEAVSTWRRGAAPE